MSAWKLRCTVWLLTGSPMPRIYYLFVSFVYILYSFLERDSYVICLDYFFSRSIVILEYEKRQNEEANPIFSSPQEEKGARSVGTRRSYLIKKTHSSYILLLSLSKVLSRSSNSHGCPKRDKLPLQTPGFFLVERQWEDKEKCKTSNQSTRPSYVKSFRDHYSFSGQGGPGKILRK